MTTANNEAYTFDTGREKPSLINRIENTQKFSDPQKFVEPGFAVTTVDSYPIMYDRDDFRHIQISKCHVPNSQGTIILRTQEAFREWK